MKLVLCVLLVLISIKECDTQQQQLMRQNKEEAIVKDGAQKKTEMVKEITYLAVSRGLYLSIAIANDSISFTNNRQMKSEVIYVIPQGEKEILISLINDINEKSLPHLEAPSKMHQFDGAAIATLELTTTKNSYKTVAFDHGNPPKPIQAVVEKMLSIKSMIEKQ
jgi:hypothetical protein